MIHVIIPVHNRLNYTKACLNSLKNQNVFKILNIIIVDDKSKDGTYNYLKKNFPKVKILKGNGKLFWCGAINFGINYVLKISKKKDWLLILNNDVTLKYDAILNLVNILKKKNRKGIAGALTISAINKKTIIKSGTIIKSWFFNITNHIFKGKDINDIKNKDPIKVDLLTGRCLLHPIEIFKKIGNYDSKNFLHYGGDDEFTIRAKRSGYAVLLNPRSIVFLEEDNKKCKHKLNLKNITSHLFSIKSSSNIVNKFKLSVKIVPFYAKISFFIFGAIKSLYIFFKK